MMIILDFFSSGTSFESGLFTFVVIAPSAIATIILLLILFKRFSIIREDILIRLKCIALMLISYIYIYNVIECFQSIPCIIAIPLKVPVLFFLGIIWIFQNPTQSPLLMVLLYSGAFIVVASYLATKGITNLRKRIVASFLIGFLIYMVASIPLVMYGLSTM